MITLSLLAASITTAVAQSESLQFTMSRTRGYSGFGGNIQGLFALTAQGPENLQSVEFMLDGKVVSEDSEPPFRFELRTDDYENGSHTLSAEGILRNGTRISSAPITREFVAPKGLLGGLGAVLIILLVIIVIFDVVLKGIGMWKAARRSQTVWFVCLLIFNTAGILPVIYFLTGGKEPETLKRTGT